MCSNEQSVPERPLTMRERMEAWFEKEIEERIEKKQWESMLVDIGGEA